MPWITHEISWTRMGLSMDIPIGEPWIIHRYFNDYPCTSHGCSLTLHALSTDHPWVFHAHPLSTDGMDSLPIIHPWILRGLSMHNPMLVRGYCICRSNHEWSNDYPWLIHGLSMNHPWISHGLFTDHAQIIFAYAWIIHGLSMDAQWIDHGLSKGDPWRIQGLSMDCLWIIHG